MRALRYDIVLWYGSLQRAWLNSTPSPGSHCAWLNLSRQTENTSVSANDRVLKVSAVQAPCRIDPPAEFFLHEITNSFDNHQPPTPFTQHLLPSWLLSLVSLSTTMVAVTDSTSAPYEYPSAQFPSCTACAAVMFIRNDSLPASCRAFWNGFKKPRADLLTGRGIPLWKVAWRRSDSRYAHWTEWISGVSETARCLGRHDRAQKVRSPTESFVS